MSDSIKDAKLVMTENASVMYGIFGIVESSGIFPPRDFLNEFFQAGQDSCDQDGRMAQWVPFSLGAEDYLSIKEWWIAMHPGTQENRLGADCWDDWVQEILSR